MSNQALRLWGRKLAMIAVNQFAMAQNKQPGRDLDNLARKRDLIVSLDSVKLLAPVFGSKTHHDLKRAGVGRNLHHDFIRGGIRSANDATNADSLADVWLSRRPSLHVGAIEQLLV